MTDALTADALRWCVDPEQMNFRSTEEVTPEPEVIGQPLAAEALRFGLDCKAPGQNVFVRGIRGTGRLSMVQGVLSEMNARCSDQRDRCYVHNFKQPDRPRLIDLPNGQARRLRRAMRELADFVSGALGEAMNSQHLQAARSSLQEEAQKSVNEITKPFEEELNGQGLALVQVKTPQGNQTAIFPLIEGQPVQPEQFETMVRAGDISADQRTEIFAKIETFAKRLPEITQKIGKVMRGNGQQINALNEKSLRGLVSSTADGIKQDFTEPALHTHLDDIVDDVAEQVLTNKGKDFDPVTRYGVNILLEHERDDRPVVLETSPSLTNLLGNIETVWDSSGQPSADYRSVRGGSLLAADGGYLILDAHDVMAEPGAWQILMRTLRTGMLEIVPRELGSPFSPVGLKPEPIAVSLRVVLIGSASLYYRLDSLDYDFAHQFKVLADFSEVLDRGPEALRQYAGVLAQICKEEHLKHFTHCGVAALAEHGARVADKAGKLTARFGRIADLAREANWVSDQRNGELTSGDDVREAVARTRQRASLPSIRFQSFLKDGTVLIETQGGKVGQVNGLAVMSAGPIKFGFPARITAAIGPGSAGIIDIESRASMSGSIHTKGFHILGGLLRHLLKTDHPMAFSASIAFEQSYGGIDGDSASGAEICCLLSALTDIPLSQELAMTGAIDQHGRIQAIGGVNEKIEGFFDICNHFGLTGNQGVIIPASNAGDLMLRQDIVEAARQGKFSVYPVARIEQALELFTNKPVGEWKNEQYPADSLLGIARRQARDFWEETARGPQPVEG
ncbi:MAG: Lon protease family protein [Lysobacterales bacterium]